MALFSKSCKATVAFQRDDRSHCTDWVVLFAPSLSNLGQAENQKACELERAWRALSPPPLVAREKLKPRGRKGLACGHAAHSGTSGVELRLLSLVLFASTTNCNASPRSR